MQEVLNKEDFYDAIIIGGGCNGSGVVLDAASRGLKVLLVEKEDFAAGTSSKSTKMLHGGVRYLEQIFKPPIFSLSDKKEKYGLIVEGLRERNYVIKNAEYLTRPMKIILPCNNYFWAMYYYIGLMMYHLIFKLTNEKAYEFPFTRPKILKQKELISKFEFLDPKIKYGVVYEDGQFDDCRLCLDNILTSTIEGYIPGMKGANVLNYTQFRNFIKDDNGKISGVALQDQITGKEFSVKTRCVINCTGVHSDKIRQLDQPKAQTLMVPSEGTHILLPENYIDENYGIIIPKTPDGRVVFVLPYQNKALVGTTDKVYPELTNHPKTEKHDLEFLCKSLRLIYPVKTEKELEEQIISYWTGYLSLWLRIRQVPNHLHNFQESILQRFLIRTLFLQWVVNEQYTGKWVKKLWIKYLRNQKVTYTNSLIFQEDYGGDYLKHIGNSQTKQIKLLGSFNKDPNVLVMKRKPWKQYYTQKLKTLFKFDIKISENLVKTYGERAYDVGLMIRQNPGYEKRIIPDFPYIVGEIYYSIKNEMAVTIKDLIDRRFKARLLNLEMSIKLEKEIKKIVGHDIYLDYQQTLTEDKEKFLTKGHFN